MYIYFFFIVKLSGIDREDLVFFFLRRGIWSRILGVLESGIFYVL